MSLGTFVNSTRASVVRRIAVSLLAVFHNVTLQVLFQR